MSSSEPPGKASRVESVYTPYHGGGENPSLGRGPWVVISENRSPPHVQRCMKDQIIGMDVKANAGGATNRRNFLGLFSGAALLAVSTGCRSTHNAPANSDGKAADLGSGDAGLANYLYVIEALSAAFYIQAVEHPYAEMNPANPAELQVLTEVRDHELVHAEFYKRFLGARAIGPLQYDFQKVDFSSRASVLRTALLFENLGVEAFNGAGKLFVSPEVLLLAGKIASVRARQASVIGDMVGPAAKEFAPRAMDRASSSSHVMRTVRPYITTQISGAGWMW
ncbi:MAG: hypothetical protein JWR26_3060 [Pedosphaera sp.]|nr:hypothetical protein [Pedosphaera sp.]